jgi:putative hydrolase of HD superfamily
VSLTADAELEGILAFLRTAERLKSTPRSGWTTAGERESVAAHTWRLSLMAAVLSDRFPGIDLARLLKICLIHDLGEALHGDVPAPQQSSDASKAIREREDLQEVLAPLPQRLREEFTALWDEYEAARTPEALLAKGLDKLETILQHTQGLNPTDFDYRFNLAYGQVYTAAHPVLAALRARLDQETEARARRPDEALTTKTEEAAMLGNNDAIATVAVKDMEAARQFYEGTLGLKPTGDQGPEFSTYRTGNSSLQVYRSQYAGTNQATAVTWMVGDQVEAMVGTLKAKGVAFERYDLPDTTRKGDVHLAGDLKVAWFKDPDGNIHSIVGS